MRELLEAETGPMGGGGGRAQGTLPWILYSGVGHAAGPVTPNGREAWCAVPATWLP